MDNLFRHRRCCHIRVNFLVLLHHGALHSTGAVHPGPLEQFILLWSFQWPWVKSIAYSSDDYNNDDIGFVLLSRSSKAIWGKAQITLRNQSVTPAANLLICTNEDITDLKVEGKNKGGFQKEIAAKFGTLSKKGGGARTIRDNVLRVANENICKLPF